jgi:hypothetical protein
MTKIPGGFDMAKVEKNSLQARITPDGFTYISNNFGEIVKVLFPSGLTFDIPYQNLGSVAGNDIELCPNGSSGNPLAPGQCGSHDGNAGQCRATVTINNMTIAPDAPANIKITADIQIDTNEIRVKSSNRPFECIFLGTIDCGIKYCTDRSSPPNMVIDTKIAFTLDTTFWELLSFDATDVNGVTLDDQDLEIFGENTCGDVWCGLANVGFIKGILVGFINGQLKGLITSQIANFKCRSCTDSTDCPGTSHCKSSKCVADADEAHCVPPLFGMEGRASLATALGSLGNFGIPADASVDVFAGAGGRVSADSGFNVGILGGTEGSAHALCVPTLPAPTIPALADVDFDGEAAKIKTDGIADLAGYHVGLSVAQPYMNKGAWSAFDAGGLCIGLGSDFTSFLSTGTFKAFLNSLGDLAPDDAPMLIALRPKQPPTITVGRGLYTTDPQGNRVLDEPLLTLGFPKLNMDFYAFIQERMVRLFTLTMDVNLPLGLDVVTDKVTGEQQLAPVLGKLDQLVTNVTGSNSEILAEDPAVLAQLIPAVIGLVQPMLSGALKPISLPAINGFQLEVKAINGVVPASQAKQYDNLGIFAGIKVKPKRHTPYLSIAATAEIVERHVPTEAEVAAGKQAGAIPVPSVVLKAGAATASPQFQYRVDGGLWNPWFAPAGDTFTVQRDVFLFQGPHYIEVRAREGDDTTTVGDPVGVTFIVDWEAPRVKLSVSAAEGKVVIDADDNTSRKDELQYRFRTARTDFGAFGPLPALSPADLGSEGFLEVEVRDTSGNVAKARYGSLSREQPGGGDPAAYRTVQVSGGCAGGPAGFLALLGLAAAWRKRKAA